MQIKKKSSEILKLFFFSGYINLKNLSMSSQLFILKSLQKMDLRMCFSSI